MIVYFSGTGNSRYCAERMAQQLDDEAVNSFHFLRDGIAAELISGKPWVYLCLAAAAGVSGISPHRQLFRQPGRLLRDDLRQ